MCIRDSPAAEAAERPRAPQAPVPAKEASQRRLSLIMGFIGGEQEGLTATMVYQLIAQERAYHEDRVLDLGMRVRFLPEAQPGESPELSREREVLLLDLAESRSLHAQLKEALAWVSQNKA